MSESTDVKPADQPINIKVNTQVRVMILWEGNLFRRINYPYSRREIRRGPLFLSILTSFLYFSLISFVIYPYSRILSSWFPFLIFLYAIGWTRNDLQSMYSFLGSYRRLICIIRTTDKPQQPDQGKFLLQKSLFFSPRDF